MFGGCPKGKKKSLKPSWNRCITLSSIRIPQTPAWACLPVFFSELWKNPYINYNFNYLRKKKNILPPNASINTVAKCYFFLSIVPHGRVNPIVKHNQSISKTQNLTISRPPNQDYDCYILQYYKSTLRGSHSLKQLWDQEVLTISMLKQQQQQQTTKRVSLHTN